VRQEVRQPHGVVHVGLAAGNVLYLRRVGQHQVESSASTAHTGFQ
jgi:hypothetical protein